MKIYIMVLNKALLEKTVEEKFTSYISDLQELVRIPSISPNKKFNNKEILSIVEKVTLILSQKGFSVKTYKTKTNPVVVGTLENDPSLPWITLYNHMDVQPAESGEWKYEDHFNGEVSEGKIWGRGTTDDKGPAMCLLYGIDTLKSIGAKLPNIQIIYETMEEIGSPGFENWLKEFGHELKNPHSILVSDTVFEGDYPAINYKLKGSLGLDINLKLQEGDLHSGLWSGVAVQPNHIMNKALNTFCDDSGLIKVQSILDLMDPISEIELEKQAEVSKILDLEKLKKDGGNVELITSNKEIILKQRGLMPTFTEHGRQGSQCGLIYEEGKKREFSFSSTIPNEIRVLGSLRLVPGLEPQKTLEKVREYFISIHPNFKIEGSKFVHPVNLGFENAFTKKAFDAYFDVFKKKPVFTAMGGTIGSIYPFQQYFKGSPIVMAALSLVEDGYHAPNESFKLDHAKKGIQFIAQYLHSIVEDTN